MRTVGLHLAQKPGTGASVLVEIEAGAVCAPRQAQSDAEILAALPEAPALVVVDAPLAIPNEIGKRDVEAVLLWCDIPAFPVSRRRIQALFGGARGVELARKMLERGYETAETLPDHVTRQLLWERARGGRAPLDLGAYRERWVQVRTPDERAARELLGEAIDLTAWPPEGNGAELSAVACAYAGWRHLTGLSSIDLGTPDRGRMLLPADTNLVERVAVNVERMWNEGTVLIPVPPGGW
jgi:predicted nuclease with RNAse H fold